MRRAAPPIPISPKLLKHFAAVTLVLTAVLAMFADEGSRAAIEDQVKSTQDYNSARKIEAEKFGARRLAGGIKDNRGPGSFGSETVDTGGGDGGGGGSYGEGPRTAPPRGPRAMDPGMAAPPPTLGMRPGASVTVQSGPYGEIEVTAGNKPRKKQPYRPDANAIAAIHQASAQRSGNPHGND